MIAENILLRAYADFNARDIEAVLSVMHADVVWPNGMENELLSGPSITLDSYLTEVQRKCDRFCSDC
jgi:hypothetical protein